MVRYRASDYFVEENGDVWSEKSHKYLKPRIYNGYKVVSLGIDGKYKNVRVHRMVAECYIPNPNNYDIVNHIDGNKLNCDKSNLEWCDVSHNNQHAYDMGLNTLKSISKPVIRINGDDISEFSSIGKGAKSVNGYPIDVKRACDNNSIYKGYSWKYKQCDVLQTNC